MTSSAPPPPTLLRVLIVDDEPPAVERLQLLLQGMDGVAVIGAAADGQSALEAIDTHRPDLVFLDVQMPHLSGMAVASRLQDDDRPEIVFVTAFEHFAAEAFEVEAADYLLKPAKYDRLRQAVDRAHRRRRERTALASQAQSPPPVETGACIWVPTRTGQVRVPLVLIDWIEANKDYVILHTARRSYLVRMTMAAVQEQLAGSDLIRIHRSAFVRPSRVAAIDRKSKWQVSVVMEDGVTLPIGPSYLDRVLEAVRRSRSAV